MANPGDNINGYEIVRELRAGEFCTSYEAIKGDKKYFLKEYSDPTPLSPDYKNFLANQRLMIPKLNALGDSVEKIVEDFEKLRYYQVKEFIFGENMGSWMQTHTNYTVRKSLALMMCDIVKTIHQAGIVHTDLKPEQFMVVPDSKSDCGFGLILTDFDWSVPDGQVVRHVGTILYSGIESDITCKTDIFTLGILLSELLTGRSPYLIDNTLVLDQSGFKAYWMQLVREKNYESPVKFCPDNITPEVSSAIVRCLDPVPENRPEIEEIKFALELDNLRLKPLIKLLFVPAPLIDKTIHIKVANNMPQLITRIKNFNMVVCEPPGLPDLRKHQNRSVARMPDLKPLDIRLKKESFANGFIQKMNLIGDNMFNMIKKLI